MMCDIHMVAAYAVAAVIVLYVSAYAFVGWMVLHDKSDLDREAE